MVLSEDPVGQWPTYASAVANVLATISYFIIPFLLIKRAKAGAEFKFSLKFWSFFICNVVHGLARIGVIWITNPNYQKAEMIFKFTTSISAIGAVISLWLILPLLVTVPSKQNLEDTVEKLAAAVKALEEEKVEKEKAQNILHQSQKMEAVGRLTGGIAHDFNNLLLAISGNLELIKCNPRSEKVNKWVGTGIDAVARAAHLTAQLLTFSRVQKLQLKEVQLMPLLKEVKDMVTRTIGPDIKVTINSTDDVTIKADPVQLELAILNLCLNSRDVMLEGGTLTITTNIDNNNVEINVTDTGSGIPDDVVARVFEPFFTTKDIGKGTGLGLSMVYGVATQSGGDVYIKKTSSKGTTISISMPMVEVEIPLATPESTAVSSNILSSKTIFIIDDDKSVRETLCEMLVSIGHDVKAFEDGVEALTYLKNHKPDLVLVDYIMPVMNGAAVFKATKLIYPDVPISYVTGYSESSVTNGHFVLKKPFSIKDLQNLIQDIFKKDDSL